MQLFYTTNTEKGHFVLTDDEHRHCSKVLRRKVGDSLLATDGFGKLYKGEISEINKSETQVRILDIEIHHTDSPRLHIAIAPTKNMSRFEWFLEKAVEIGVHSIEPILGRYSERKILKIERCQKIMLAAMKQSLRFSLPEILPLRKMEELLEEPFDGEKYIAYIPEDGHNLQKHYKAGQNLRVLIGPEGGFTEQEYHLAKAKNYRAVSLGKHRLRTETAGVVVSQIVASAND